MSGNQQYVKFLTAKAAAKAFETGACARTQAGNAKANPSPISNVNTNNACDLLLFGLSTSFVSGN